MEMDTFTKSLLQIANFIQKACQRNIMDTVQSQYCKLRIAKCPLEYEFAKKMTPPKFQSKSFIQRN